MANPSVDNVVNSDPAPVELVCALEALGLGPQLHLGAALSWILRAHKAPRDRVSLDLALWYLARAVDKYEPEPFADEGQVSCTIANWGLSGQLAHAVKAITDGSWVRAHLCLTIEREQRGG